MVKKISFEVTGRNTLVYIALKEKSICQQYRNLQNCSRIYYPKIHQQQNTLEEIFWKTLLLFRWHHLEKIRMWQTLDS